MTDTATPAPPSITGPAGRSLDPAQAARIERLRQQRARRSEPAPSPSTTPTEAAQTATSKPTPEPPATRRSGRRRHPALGSRIAAAGLGATAMLGLVTAMGLAGERSAPGVAPAPPVVVVVHRTPASAAPSPPNQPVRLVANPVVRAVPAPAAGSGPVARTNGSR